MQDVLTSQSDSFKITLIQISEYTITTKKYKSFTLRLISVNHGIVPALALAIEKDCNKR